MLTVYGDFKDEWFRNYEEMWSLSGAKRRFLFPPVIGMTIRELLKLQHQSTRKASDVLTAGLLIALAVGD